MDRTGTISSYESGVDLVVEWNINSFFTLSERDAAYYSSPDFSFGGERWFLQIRPNGSSESDSSGHVDLVLWKKYSDRSIKQSFSLSLKTAKGKKYNEQNVTKDFEKGCDYHSFNRFIQRSDLTRRRYELVPDGVLTVVCTMKSSTSAGSASNTASTSDKCCHCKEAFDAESLSSHQRKCMHRPIKCPDCLEVVVLQKWLDKHECQKERSQAENSENIHMEASTQTREENEEVKEVSAAELNKGDTLEVSLSGDTKASGSNQTGIAKTENVVSSINLPEERDWMTDVRDFLIEGTGVDVTFELPTPNGKVEFFAHQLILALRSPYFADEFYGKGKNNRHLRISLKGIDPKAFKEMLRYCYDNKPRLRTIEDACVLFKVASDFKMLNLQKLCRTFIRDAEIDP